MKFTAILFSAAVLITGAVAASSTTTSAAPVNTDPSYTPEINACLKACDVSDVNCSATCFGNPNPTAEQVNETTQCMGACEQGNGTAEQTKKYADCQTACINKNFLPNASYSPTGTSTESGATETSSDAPASTTDSKGNVVKVNTTSGTTSGSSPSETNGASAMAFSASFAGVVAAFAAFIIV